jgi:hypothetical protein
MKNDTITLDCVLMKGDHSDFTEKEYDDLIDKVTEFFEGERIELYCCSKLIDNEELDDEKRDI